MSFFLVSRVCDIFVCRQANPVDRHIISFSPLSPVCLSRTLGLCVLLFFFVYVSRLVVRAALLRSSGMCPRLSLQRRPSVKTCSRQSRTLFCPRLTPTSHLHPKQRTACFRQPSSQPFAPTSWDRNIPISSLKMMMLM